MRLLIVSTLVALNLSLASQATAQTAQQLRIRWDAYSAASPEVEPGVSQASTLFTVLERLSISTGVARQRNPELSAEQVLVRAFSAGGVLIDSQLILDTRIIRSETPDATGALGGQVLHRAAPEFLLTIPDDPAIAETRLYHPRWTGTVFALDPLGTIVLN